MIVFDDNIFKSILDNCEDEITFLEAAANTYFIRDELYPKVDAVLKTPEGKKQFSKIVGDYINANSAKLTTIGPIYQTAFNYKDKEAFYKLFNTDEQELKAIINKMTNAVNDKANWRLVKDNPIFVLLYCCIRYFTINPDPKLLNNALIITALAFYPSVFNKFFKFDANPGVMQYTIDNLSERFIIKKSKHIFATLAENIQSAWEFHKNLFADGSDAEVIHFIQRVRNGQNSLIKKIANNYHENYKKGLSVSNSVDTFADGINVNIENDTNKVENITNKVILRLLTNGINLQLCDFAANASNISKIELRNYLTKIVNEKNSQDMKNLIESILFLYLYTEKHTYEEINSRMFISFALALFKKTNSKDKNIKNIKDILDKWGELSGIYGKFSRLATRVDYTKGIYLYFIMSIQQFG